LDNRATFCAIAILFVLLRDCQYRALRLGSCLERWTCPSEDWTTLIVTSQSFALRRPRGTSANSPSFVP
jgi:hypothetical protein